MKPRVFVTQDSPRLNLQPAERFGVLVPVMGGGFIRPLRAQQAMQQISEVLRDFGPQDFVLPAGDPAAIAGVCIVAALKSGGNVRLLRWDRHLNDYEIVQLGVENVKP